MDRNLAKISQGRRAASLLFIKKIDHDLIFFDPPQMFSDKSFLAVGITFGLLNSPEKILILYSESFISYFEFLHLLLLVAVSNDSVGKSKDAIDKQKIQNQKDSHQVINKMDPFGGNP
jgi:hypothetical protein